MQKDEKLPNLLLKVAMYKQKTLCLKELMNMERFQIVEYEWLLIVCTVSTSAGSGHSMANMVIWTTMGAILLESLH